MTTHADHRVVAGILVRDNRVLLCHRRDDRTWYPGTWDLVGGHVEPGESAAEALTRECAEELDVAIRAPEFVVRFQSPETDMTFFMVTSWAGEPRNFAPEEHQSIGWFETGDIAQLPLSDPRLGPLINDALEALDRAGPGTPAPEAVLPPGLRRAPARAPRPRHPQTEGSSGANHRHS